MSAHKLLSILLEYPSTDLFAHLTDVRACASALPPEQRTPILAFLDWLATTDPLEVQGQYVEAFDMAPEHSLHLTHHIFGADRNRGPALIDLGEMYRHHGLTPDSNEIPDYLPLMLEFCALAPAPTGDRLLGDASKVLGVLADNLEQAGCRWAPLVRMVQALGVVEADDNTSDGADNRSGADTTVPARAAAALAQRAAPGASTPVFVGL